MSASHAGVGASSVGDDRVSLEFSKYKSNPMHIEIIIKILLFVSWVKCSKTTQTTILYSLLILIWIFDIPWEVLLEFLFWIPYLADKGKRVENKYLSANC